VKRFFPRTPLSSQGPAILALLSALLTSCSGLFYQQDRVLYYLPHRVGYEAHEVTFTASDGTKLVGWFFPAHSLHLPPPRPKGTIIQFHGNAENMSSHFISLAWVVDHGYNFFTFDYRGYGKSEGSPDQKGTCLDGLAAIDEAWKLHQESGASSGFGRFVVYGQSLGGAIALRALQDSPHRSEVSLLVMDSTFVSYQTVAHKMMARFWLSWPLQWLPYLLVSDQYSAETALKEWKKPLLVIHDQRDPAVPFSMGEQIYADSGSKDKEIWALNQGMHIGTFVNAEPYRKKFLDKLELTDLAP
jgi:uncharacterized protein